MALASTFSFRRFLVGWMTGWRVMSGESIFSMVGGIHPIVIWRVVKRDSGCCLEWGSTESYLWFW
jgi:hypothetical protein